MEKKTLTTSTGMPVDSNQFSMTAGPRGHILLQDFHLIDKLAKFDRERIPERKLSILRVLAHMAILRSLTTSQSSARLSS